MALYCWGSTINGELGLGGIEEEQVHTAYIILYIVVAVVDWTEIESNLIVIFFLFESYVNIDIDTARIAMEWSGWRAIYRLWSGSYTVCQ